jgi:hypothetical protein
MAFFSPIVVHSLRKVSAGDQHVTADRPAAKEAPFEVDCRTWIPARLNEIFRKTAPGDSRSDDCLLKRPLCGDDGIAQIGNLDVDDLGRI